MRSPLGRLLRPRNQGKPPIPLDNGYSARRGLSFNLGNGRSDAETMMRQYGISGTIYGIISLLAESAATPTWKLYKKQPVDGRRRYSTTDQGSDQRTEVVQHAAIQLWNSPNAWHSGFEFREGSQQHEELTGETFWVLDMEAGFPTSMWYVRPDRMEPVPDPDDFLIGWIYRSPSGEQVPLKADEVILEKRPNPLDPYRGAGPVASILPNIQQQRYATEYQRNLFLNGADPGGLITVPNKLSDLEFDELIDRWRESHRGVARAGHVGVLEDGATWTQKSQANKDMEYNQLRLTNRDELREAWRIHKHMMGTSDDVNRASAQTAEEVFVAWQVLPRLNRRRDTLNSKLLPLFARADKSVEFDYDDPSPVNAETAATELLTKAQAAQALILANFEPHAVLETVGLPDMDTVEAALQPAAPPAPPAGGGFGPARPGELQKNADAAPGAERQTGNRVREVITLRGDYAPYDAAAAKKANHRDLSQVDQQWQQAVAILTAAYAAQIIPAQQRALCDQVRRLVDAGNLTALATLSISSSAGAALILTAMAGLAAIAARTAAAEGVAQGAVGVAPRQPDAAMLERIAETTATLQAAQLALSAGAEASRVATPGATGEQVAQVVGQFLSGLSAAFLTGRLAGALSAAQNGARLATFAAGPRAELAATEVHDGNTCPACDDIDGRLFGYTDDPAAIAAAQAAYPSGGYVNCEGTYRCRGTLIANYQATNTGAGAGTPGAWSSTAALPAVPPLPTITRPLDVRPLAHLMRASLNGHVNGHSKEHV